MPVERRLGYSGKAICLYLVKLSIRVFWDPAVLFLDRHLREVLRQSHSEIHTGCLPQGYLWSWTDGHHLRVTGDTQSTGPKVEDGEPGHTRSHVQMLNTQLRETKLKGLIHPSFQLRKSEPKPVPIVQEHTRAGEMAQLVQRLPQKCEDLSSTPDMHKSRWVSPAFGKQRQEDP